MEGQSPEGASAGRGSGWSVNLPTSQQRGHGKAKAWVPSGPADDEPIHKKRPPRGTSQRWRANDSLAREEHKHKRPTSTENLRQQHRQKWVDVHNNSISIPGDGKTLVNMVEDKARTTVKWKCGRGR